MAIDFGDKTRATQLLLTHHRVEIIVELMDLSHNYMGELSHRLLSGQVNIDVTADITRQATLELLDPQHQLNLDDDAPDDGAVYFTRMIKITYVIAKLDLSERHFIPIFCGPITKLDRTGPIVSLECSGKEILSMDVIWQSKTLKKGMKKIDAIRRVMSLGGEATRKMATPKKPEVTLGHNMSTSRKFTFWRLAQKLARSMHMHLFYDGRGVLVLRRVPSKTMFHFRDTESILSDPDITYDSDEMYNAVLVIGGKPKGATKKIQVRVVAKGLPSKWGRNQIERYKPLVIEDDSIKSRKRARQLAQRELKNVLDQGVEVAFDSLPVPFLEERDLCRYTTDYASGRFRLTKMSIPLVGSGSASVGYLRNVSMRRAKKKNKKNKGKKGRNR